VGAELDGGQEAPDRAVLAPRHDRTCCHARGCPLPSRDAGFAGQHTSERSYTRPVPDWRRAIPATSHPHDAQVPTREVQVWDVPVRVVHWVQASLVALSVATGFTGGNALRIHRLSGYTILTLVTFRAMWGFAGSRHARFATFLKGPRDALVFLRETLARHLPIHVGHNPLAGWNIVALLASLLVQASTGLFANDDISFQGPLARLVSSGTSDALTIVHKTNARILLTLVALHLGAVLFHLVFERRNVVTPMLTGRIRVPRDLEAPDAGQYHFWRAAVLFVLAVAAVVLIVNAPGLGRTGGSP
jgi:cytochrome b